MGTYRMLGGPTLCIGPCSARHWDQSTQQRESGLSQCTTHALSQPGLLCLFPASAVPGRRQNTIVVKVPGQDDSHNEDGESGSEASDSVSNCGQPGSQNIGSNVTLITLNSEGAFLGLSWLCLCVVLLERVWLTVGRKRHRVMKRVKQLAFHCGCQHLCPSACACAPLKFLPSVMGLPS